MRSYEKRPCSIKSLDFWRIPRFFLCMGMDRMDISSMHSVYVNMCICNCMYLIFLSWISAHLCIHLYYVISYSGPSHFELSWHEMHIGKHNQNCGEYWRMLGRHVLWKNALSIECFSPCNSSMHFFSVGKSAWMHVNSEYRGTSDSKLRFVSVKSNQCGAIFIVADLPLGRMILQSQPDQVYHR